MELVGAANMAEPFPTNRKMPGPSYDLPASACLRGSHLASVRNSTCHEGTCYAKRGFFRMGNVRASSERHLRAVIDGRIGDWLEAFVFILRERYRDEAHFRWHASGDLQSYGHLIDINAIAKACPWMSFWLPTHEPFLVREALRYMVQADNLTIRISSDILGQPAEHTFGLPSSMVHYDYGDPPLVNGRKVVECRAHDRGNNCGTCRACWRRDVDVVSYPRTTPHGVTGTGRRSAQLRIFQ